MPYTSADPNAFIGIGMQSGLGSPQSTAGKFRFAKYLQSDLNIDITAVDLREGGDGLDFGFTYKQKQVARGQIVVNGRPEIAGQLLSQVLGGATWDGGSAPANHTFMSGHASFPWSTIIGQQPGSAMAYFVSDVRFTGFTLDAVSGQPWKFTFPFVALNYGASMAAFVPTYYGDAPFLYYNSPTYLIDGGAATGMTEFHLTVAYGIDEILSQAVTLDEAPVLNRDSNLTMTRRFENPGLWQKIYYGASGNITPTPPVATGSLRAAVLYGAGANVRSLDVNMQLLSYRQNTIAGLNPDGQTVYEQIQAKVLKGATHAIFALLANGHASAYGS